MMRSILLPAAGLIFLLSGCVPSTPQARMAANPAAYEALSPQHQELVSQGFLAKGMPKSGVLIALGTPDRRSNGFMDGAAFDRWDYASLRPVYTGSFGGSYLGGCGYHGGGHGWGYGPVIQYVPQRDASVWFRGERVHAWDRVHSRYRY